MEKCIVGQPFNEDENDTKHVRSCVQYAFTHILLLKPKFDSLARILRFIDSSLVLRSGLVVIVLNLPRE
jgi:hypothetical protein